MIMVVLWLAEKNFRAKIALGPVKTCLQTIFVSKFIFLTVNQISFNGFWLLLILFETDHKIGVFQV